MSGRSLVLPLKPTHDPARVQSVESEGPDDERRVSITLVSPQFRDMDKVEDRDQLVWEAIKVHATVTGRSSPIPCPWPNFSSLPLTPQEDVHGIKHVRLRAWTPEDDQLHHLRRQAPAFFADNK